MSSDRVDNRYILNELNRAVKTLQFYPKGHPNLDATLDKVYSIIKKRVADEGEFHWTVEKDGFYSDDMPIAPPSWPVSALAKEFFARKVKAVTFTPRLLPGDIRSFLSLLVFAPHELQEKGGAEGHLSEAGVAGILINEMRFEESREPRRELPDDEKAIFAETEGQGGASLEEIDLPQREAGPEDKEETLEEMLSRMEGEADFLRYNDLAVRVSEKASLLRAQGDYDTIFSVLKRFLSHMTPGSGRPDIIASAARNRLVENLTTDVLYNLVERAGRKDEPERDTVERLMLMGGEEAVKILLTALVETPEMQARRNVFNTVLLFGDRIRPEVIKRLDDDRWYGVRQMVSLLGEIGDLEDIEHLERMFYHPDARVRQAVLKALSGMPSKKTTDILLRALGDSDRLIQGQAAISLGMHRDPASVDRLSEIASAWDVFRDTGELKKEAIRALGIIGDARAVPCLKAVLLKNVWFNKGLYEEMRILAASSLERIGTAQAYEAIERAADRWSDEFQATAKRMLERKRQ